MRPAGNGESGFKPAVRRHATVIAMVIAGALGAGTAAAVATVSFNNAHQYPLGRTGAVLLAPGAFRPGGKIDIANAPPGGTGGGDLLGDGTGAFTSGPGFAGSPAGSIDLLVAGDLRGNGLSDLVSAAGSGSDVQVFRASGSGGFSPATGPPLAGPDSPSALAIADVNHDGHGDLISADGTGFSVMLGDGTGHLAAPVAHHAITPAGLNANGIVVTDLNGDGLPDIVETFPSDTSESSQVAVMINRGGGVFAPPKLYPLSGQSHPTAIAVGDVTGHGHKDLVIATPGDGTITVLPGRGDGRFDPAAAITSPSGVTSANNLQLGLADIDGDGRLDVVILNGSGQTIGVMTGNGAGRFAAPVHVAGSVDSFAIGDFNHDGKPDLAVGSVADLSNTNIAILLNTSIGPVTRAPVARFSAPTSIPRSEPLVFDGGASSGRGLHYRWDFDGSGRFATDGGTSPVIRHAFARAGRVRVGLEVIDAANRSSKAYRDLTVRYGSAIILYYTPLRPRVGQMVHLRLLTGAPLGSGYAYLLWRFGDHRPFNHLLPARSDVHVAGAKIARVNPAGGANGLVFYVPNAEPTYSTDNVRTFVKPGTYTVQVKGVDKSGAEDSATTRIRIYSARNPWADVERLKGSSGSLASKLKAEFNDCPRCNSLSADRNPAAVGYPVQVTAATSSASCVNDPNNTQTIKDAFNAALHDQGYVVSGGAGDPRAHGAGATGGTQLCKGSVEPIYWWDFHDAPNGSHGCAGGQSGSNRDFSHTPGAPDRDLATDSHIFNCPGTYTVGVGIGAPRPVFNTNPGYANTIPDNPGDPQGAGGEVTELTEQITVVQPVPGPIVINGVKVDAYPDDHFIPNAVASGLGGTGDQVFFIVPGDTGVVVDGNGADPASGLALSGADSVDRTAASIAPQPGSTIQASLGSLGLSGFRGGLTLPAPAPDGSGDIALSSVKAASDAKVAGLPATEAAITLHPDRPATADVTVKPPGGFSAGPVNGVDASSLSDPSANFTFGPRDVQFGPVSVNNMQLDHDAKGWHGGGEFVVSDGSGGSLLDLDATYNPTTIPPTGVTIRNDGSVAIGVAHGSERSPLSATEQIPIGSPSVASINYIGASFASSPFEVQGNLGLQFPPGPPTATHIQLDGCAGLADVQPGQSSFLFPFCGVGATQGGPDIWVRATARASLTPLPILGSLSLANAQADLHINNNPSLDFEADLGKIEISVGSIENAHIHGAFTFRPFQFELDGGGDVCVADLACLGGAGLVSTNGLAGCIEVHIPFIVRTVHVHGGFGVDFRDGHVITFGGGGACDIVAESGLGISPALDAPSGHGPPSAHAAVTTRTLTLPPVALAESLVFTGAGGAPRISLSGPGKRMVTDDGQPIQKGNGYVLYHLAKADRTVVFLAYPPAGRWTLTTPAGTPAITSIQAGNVLPPPAVTAHVVRLGRRLFLAYHVVQQPGQRIVVEDQGRSDRSTIGMLKGGSGKIALSFAPKAGLRTIVAHVFNGHLPRMVLTLTRYHNPGPPAVGRVQQARTHRTARLLSIRWKRASNASTYRITVLAADGIARIIWRPGRATGLKLPGLPASDPLTVTIVAVGSEGQLGRAVRLRIAAAVHPATRVRI